MPTPLPSLEMCKSGAGRGNGRVDERRAPSSGDSLSREDKTYEPGDYPTRSSRLDKMPEHPRKEAGDLKARPRQRAPETLVDHSKVGGVRG